MQPEPKTAIDLHLFYDGKSEPVWSWREVGETDWRPCALDTVPRVYQYNMHGVTAGQPTGLEPIAPPCSVHTAHGG